MKLFKRSVLYIQRNYKTIIKLFLIIFILGNMMCIVSSIQTSSSALSKVIKERIGATVVYSHKTINNPDESIDSVEKLENIQEYVNVINQMIQHDSVKYANYSYILDLHDQYENVHIGVGVNQSPMVDVLENKIEIIEGRELTQEEINHGNYVILVSENSTVNGKKVQLGDEIPMKNICTSLDCDTIGNCDLVDKYGNNYSLKVVGIFKKVEKAFDISNDFDYRFYIPNNTLKKIFDEQKELTVLDGRFSTLHLGVSEVFIRLKNSDDLNSYLKYIKPLLMNDYDDNEELLDTIVTSDDEYEVISLPIQILPILGNILLIGSAVVFSILLSLLLISVIKERIYEIGILLALGEKKFKVIMQLFIELMMISMLSISCSFISGNVLSNITGNYLVTDEMLEEIEVEEVDIDKKEYMVFVYGSSCAIIILSLIYPSIIINRQNPKEILLK